jgi:hypothetical protein
MEADELFDHALTSLPEAVGDLLRDNRDPCEFVFASFDGASELGMALIASDLAGDIGLDVTRARCEVEQMIKAAGERGEELVVSLMVTREAPLVIGHFRVVAISGEQVRAATVDGVSELEDAPVSSSMLN